MKYIIKDEQKIEVEPEQTIELSIGFDGDDPVLLARNLSTGCNAIVATFGFEDVIVIGSDILSVGLGVRYYPNKFGGPVEMISK